MGRPRASSSNRDFAVSFAFANCVTVFSVQEFDCLVARSGRYGIFELMYFLAQGDEGTMCVLEPN
jgi:hypothetical protein